MYHLKLSHSFYVYILLYFYFYIKSAKNFAACQLSRHHVPITYPDDFYYTKSHSKLGKLVVTWQNNFGRIIEFPKPKYNVQGYMVIIANEYSDLFSYWMTFRKFYHNFGDNYGVKFLVSVVPKIVGENDWRYELSTSTYVSTEPKDYTIRGWEIYGYNETNIFMSLSICSCNRQARYLYILKEYNGSIIMNVTSELSVFLPKLSDTRYELTVTLASVNNITSRLYLIVNPISSKSLVIPNNTYILLGPECILNNNTDNICIDYRSYDADYDPLFL